MSKSIKKVLLILLILLVSISCENTNDVSELEILTIASKQVDCVGVAPQKCYLVKRTNEKSWSYFYSAIIGFTYEEGFEYKITVLKTQIANPMQDASSIEYELIEIISKIKKESENLPN